MKRLLFALCLTTAGVSAVSAAENSPEEAATVPPPAITLKHLSSFTGDTTRNPFWPIGWAKPNPKDPTSVQVTPLLSPSAFALTSITTGGGERFAILNGKVVQEGGQFSLAVGSQSLQVTVQAIDDGQVILAYPGGQLVVPLRRR
ncbi:MAG: hypothetical protein ACR2MW_11205 [Chthoniobacterales bacterium]